MCNKAADSIGDVWPPTAQVTLFIWPLPPITLCDPMREGDTHLCTGGCFTASDPWWRTPTPADPQNLSFALASLPTEPEPFSLGNPYAVYCIGNKFYFIFYMAMCICPEVLKATGQRDCFVSPDPSTELSMRLTLID